MRVLCDDTTQDQFILKIIDCLRYTTKTINAMSDMTKTTSVLIQLSPNLIIFKQENITPEVKAYCDKNKVKIISVGDNNDKHGDFFISSNASLTHNGLGHIQKYQIPNLLMRNHKPKDHLRSKISLISSNQTNDFYMQFLDKNYKMRFYGLKRIASPQYLGQIDDLQRGSILASSDINIDINSYTYIDAILLNCYPIIYTDMELPDTMSKFSSILELVNTIEYVENNPNDIKDKLHSMQKELFEKSNVVLTNNILNTLGFEKEAKALEELKESLI
jgi:hypothetical protein